MIGCVVEGHGEERVVVTVLNWLGAKRTQQITRADGVDDLMHNAGTYARLQQRKGATRVLFFFDADGPTPEPAVSRLRQSLAQSGFSDETIDFVPVHQLEAWLLADEEALSTVLEASVEGVAVPEAPNPLGRIKEIFASGGIEYQKFRHAREIAERASDGAWKRCPSYLRSTSPLRSA